MVFIDIRNIDKSNIFSFFLIFFPDSIVDNKTKQNNNNTRKKHKTERKLNRENLVNRQNRKRERERETLKREKSINRLLYISGKYTLNQLKYKKNTE